MRTESNRLLLLPTKVAKTLVTSKGKVEGKQALVRIRILSSRTSALMANRTATVKVGMEAPGQRRSSSNSRSSSNTFTEYAKRKPTVILRQRFRKMCKVFGQCMRRALVLHVRQRSHRWLVARTGSIQSFRKLRITKCRVLPAHSDKRRPFKAVASYLRRQPPIRVRCSTPDTFYMHGTGVVSRVRLFDHRNRIRARRPPGRARQLPWCPRKTSCTPHVKHPVIRTRNWALLLLCRAL